ncbi:sterol carrier family protein [Clavibacter michiganensis]|nr:sterol carrier family protein [Clavibacter michiganensis]
MAKARIHPTVGQPAVRAALARGADADRETRATAVRFLLQALADLAPGGTVEVRVPPFGAVQCIEGPGHTRGTPPNVIETDPATWIALATGGTSWEAGVEAGAVRASGLRADLRGLLPVPWELPADR